METGDSYSVREAARLLGHTPRHIRLLADQGELLAEKDPSGNWRLDRASVHARLQQQRQQHDLAAEPEPETLRERELEAELRELIHRLGKLEGQLQLGEKAESTIRELMEAERRRAEEEHQRAERLEEEARQLRERLERAERSWWRRLLRCSREN